MITAGDFRRTMRLWPTGVAIVASTRADGTSEGMTVNSLISLELEPPLILVSLARSSRTLEAVIASGMFGVSMLGQGAKDLCLAFARPQGERTFDEFESFEGVPVARDSLVAIACRVEHTQTVAEHDLVIGRVISTKFSSVAFGPLVFYEGALRDLGVAASPFDFYDGW